MDQDTPLFGLKGLHPMLARMGQLIDTGGPVLTIIVGLSVLALAIILLKAIQFARLGLASRTFVDGALAAWHTGEPDRALAVLSRTHNPIARTMERAIRGKRDRSLDRHDLEEDVARDGAVRIAELRRYLRLLELIATVSPLLGLLGTVLGMIDAFQALEAAGSRVNPAILSGGIWVALLTTAAGLIVAIPAAAAHNIFDGIAERYTQSLEHAVTQILVGPARSAATALPQTQAGQRLASTLAH